MSGNIIDISDIGLLIKAGVQYYDKKSYVDAHRIFTRILRIDQSNFEAHFYLSAIYEIVGEYQKAIEEFEILIRLKDDDLDLKEFLLQLYMKRGKYRKALSLFRKLLEKEQYSFKYWEMLIDLLIKADKFNFFLSRTILIHNHKSMANDVILRAMLIYRDSDQLHNALLLAETLIMIDSTSPINHYFVGTIYEVLNDTDRLKEEFCLTSELLKKSNISNNILYQEINNRLSELGIH